ncbi:hypothetical protein B0H66DRAFT_565736 [Apodospora peruviana]|uniref:N-acetyltransferase domain-containing protein n=1 Tax=Apodospora peruviana TaxID=516989 RepID=A0AAE0HZT1_9PEZI|nr:hypothetical protein B0H66DRAFT_565736 [Apodospora peruviana]
MVFAVLPALIPDIGPVYDAYFAAFGADHDGRVLLDIIFPDGFESAEFRKAHTAGTLAYWHQAPTQYTIKCVDSRTAEVVGMALFDVYPPIPEGESDDVRHKFPGIPWLQGERLEKAHKVLSPLYEARGKVWGNKAYIYVHAVAVDPKFQGRGAGAALTQHIIDLGNRGQLPIYLESSPKSEGLYKKLGFERLSKETASVVHKKGVLGSEADVEVPLMVKSPSPIS